ncbi:MULTISPECIES: glucose 1-dehydrogenase [unclassified Pseudonocardia]|jgi:NAD(P)-dependent dehydrogenase (short-subunit alcohol dehydrogenase family)|uniref:SDR family NAD(P)-dependent oxidoreductase n=1 Tax=unclassified Pseudonocardia TaxID=2619320 RepID=UPI0009692D24|nr:MULTISPECIES: glucose 1-dehydrogenase [unclassified Pseudonocardia]MBN9099098.1 glucose 1-dehydrogenase [Pseudonocardia sp.]OJY53071.1 MAG: short-chain dehydrogenase [Pseudonocardia sp. 73-21]
MSDLFDLTGRTALITGGSRGLGREMALAFARAGADVAVASRHLDACEAVADEVRALGREASAHACHLGRWDEIGALADAVTARFGRVDVLVNNAGKSPLYDRLTDLTEAQYDSVLDLNLKGPFRLTALLAERMQAAGRGSVINISSIGALRPDPSAAPYSAAKAGLNALTVALAHTYGPEVRVNAIAPGAFATDIARAWTPDVVAALEARTALHRVGRPSEIVGAALYLASDASTYTTGTILQVDGGTR